MKKPGKKEKKKGKIGGGVAAVEAQINKGLTKHQAVNAAAGAGSVRCPAPK